MTTYYVDDGGSNTSPYDTWAKAATTLQTAVTAASAGDLINVETTHRETNAVGNITINGKSGNGVQIVRLDNTGDSYDPDGATENLETTASTWKVVMNYGMAVYGLRMKSIHDLYTGGDSDGMQLFKDCYFTMGPGRHFRASLNCVKYEQCTFKTTDSANSSGYAILPQHSAPPSRFVDCTLSTGFEYRNVLFSGNGVGMTEIIGCDLSAATRNPTSLVVGGAAGHYKFIDTNLPANYQVLSAVNDAIVQVDLVRCNGTDETELHRENGSLISEATIVRTGGATNSLEAITNSFCGQNNPLFTPWVYKAVTATGSTNFDMHFAYSGTRLTDEEIFLEVEIMDSATAPYGDRFSSQKKAVLGDTVGNPTTASETWGGTETYEEYLRVTASVGVANSIVRARIGIEKTSQTDEVYIDPELEIS